MVALTGDAVVAVSLEKATAKLKTVTPDWLKLLDTLTALKRSPEGQKAAA
jgi:hypothetical protein